MLLVDSHTLEKYLRDTGRIEPNQVVTVRELSGGVSNIVLLVSSADGAPLFVVKQARNQLRVPDPWFCSMDRIWREVDVLEQISEILTRSASSHDETGLLVSAPQLLFQDRENYLYAMSAAPAHEVWKERLLRGQVEPPVAAGCGRMLGAIHSSTWNDGRTSERFSDRSFFDALRLDPYYRHIGRQHPECNAAMTSLIESLADHPRCLVHGDFSPKNILVHARGLTLVDFEVGHFGDPAFDLGFFLTHLMLKAVRAGKEAESYVQLTWSFWKAYEQQLVGSCGLTEYADLVRRAVLQFAGCMLARVDGKSRVDYLETHNQELVRRFARDLLAHPAANWQGVTARFQSMSPQFLAT